MSKYLLLANVGNRDLMLAGQDIRPARAKGKELFEHFADHKGDLSAPILSPVIQAIRADDPEAQIDLRLFCTNQESAEDRFRENDTWYFGECIKKLLGGQKPVGRVTLQGIHANPNLYDSMFQHFYEELSRIHDHLGEYSKIFVTLAGGIPACNMALCLQAVRIFGERCVVVYPVEGSERAVPLQIGDQLLKSAKHDILRQQLSNYEYAAAAALLDNLGMTLHADLARLALSRLNFDFQRARMLAAELVRRDLGEIRNYGLKVEADLKRLLNEDFPSLMLELYYNAAIKFKKEEYLDFLGRLFRFQEATLRYLVETSELALTTEIDKDGRHFTAFQASVRRHPGLVSYLEGQTYSNDKLKWDEPYTPCLMAILRYLIERGEGQKRSGREKVLQGLEEIERLTGLRNKSPLGHGFEGVSRETIEARVAGFSPERLQYVVHFAGLIGSSDNPYYRVNTLILKGLM